MEAKDIIELIITICSLIGVIGGLIPTGIALFNKIKEIIKNKDWLTVCHMAQSAMSEAEAYAKEHPEMTGKDKLEMAVKSVQQACAAAGITIDDSLLNRLVEYINELCSWSKTVNAEVVVEETKEIAE